jgi:hypothetical protein
MALENGSKDRVVPWAESRQEGDDGVPHHRPRGGLRTESS